MPRKEFHEAERQRTYRSERNIRAHNRVVTDDKLEA